HAAIALAVQDEFHLSYHAVCCRHLMMNLSLKRDKTKALFWRICKAYTTEEFSTSMSHLQDIQTDAYDKLCQKAASVKVSRDLSSNGARVILSMSQTHRKISRRFTTLYYTLPPNNALSGLKQINNDYDTNVMYDIARVAGKIQLFVSHHQIDLSTVLIPNDGSLEEALKGFLGLGGGGGNHKKKGSSDKEKQASAANGSDKDNYNRNEATISTPNGRQDVNVGPSLWGPTSYTKLVTRETNRNVSPTHRKSVNFHTLITPSGNGDDVVERLGKYGVVKSMLNSSTRLFFFQFSFMDGLDSMPENGLLFIRNNPLIWKKWNPDVNLLKEDVGNVPIWVKLYVVHVTAFSEDGLSAIATKLGSPLMLDSYTSDIYMQSWGRSSYTRVMIELRIDVELKDTIMVAMPKLFWEGFYTCTIRVDQAPRGVLVCPKVGFKPVKQVYRPVSKKNNANTSGNKKKDAKSIKEVTPNPFDVLNSVENDVDFGTNTGTSNLASKEANSSGSSFWNVGSSSTSTTPTVVEKIDNLEKRIIDEKIILVDDEGKPLKKVNYSGDHDSGDEVQPVDNEIASFLASKRYGYGINSLLEQWRETYENADYDYDQYDDMYEGKEIPDNIQSICDKLDIKLRDVHNHYIQHYVVWIYITGVYLRAYMMLLSKAPRVAMTYNSFILCTLLTFSICLHGISAMDYFVTNEAASTPGGIRFDQEIGIPYTKQIMGRAPSGLMEGVADYTKLKAGYAQDQGFAKPGQGDSWYQGYDVTARFLEYCDEIVPGFVASLNKLMRFDFDVKFFEYLTGKAVDQLWMEYKAKSRVDPTLLNDFEMDTDGNGDLPPPLAKPKAYMLWEPVILTNLKGNNQGRNQFFRGPSHGQNPPPAYQAPGYQAPVHQPPIPQPQVVTTTEFTNYMKANDAILKNMQTNMTSLTNSNLELKNMFGQFMKMNIASSSGSGTLPSNTITNPKEDLKCITTRMPPTNNGSTKDVQPPIVQIETQKLNSEPVVAPVAEPVVAPVSALKPNPKPSISYPFRLHDQKLRDKANDQKEKFFQIFKDFNFNISFADALILMPKFGLTIKILLTKKDKLFELARASINEHCSAVLLKKLPEKLGDPDKFLILCDFIGMDECLALADPGASINLMPLSVWNKLSFPELSPTCMTLKLMDRLISRPVGVAKDIFVKVGVFHFLADIIVVDFDTDPRVLLILRRSFLKTGRALIDVYERELTLRVGKEAVTFYLDQTSRYFANYDAMSVNRIYLIDVACEEYSQEVLRLSTSGNLTLSTEPIVSNSSPTLTPFKDSDFLLEETDAFLAIDDEPILPKIDDRYYDSKGDILLLEEFLNDDPSSPPLPSQEQKVIEATTKKSSINEPPVVELKDLPPHLEYAFLEGDDKLPVIIAKDLKDEETTALIKDDFKPVVQHQRRVNPKIHESIKKEVLKLLDAELIYPISDSPWVSPVHGVPKKGGFTIVENEKNELIPTRLVTGWYVCIDYRKLNDDTRKDYFPLSFMDQMLERLAGNKYYCFLDGFSGYFQIPIDPQDQEKTTFTCPYGTFAYRRMPFGLCNAPSTFQRCMMANFMKNTKLLFEDKIQAKLDKTEHEMETMEKSKVNPVKVKSKTEPRSKNC
nr:reverse transcriptase domain-containing protein [Tanacetum cinerariifolium]